jgi:hypothetical protein
MDNILKPADIFLTRGTSFISRAIRVFTRKIGESRTKVNHVGIVVEGGTLKTAMMVEALHKVVEHTLWSEYCPPSQDCVAVYRAKNLSDEEIQTIVAAARKYVGRNYGYPQILAHLLDWTLQGAYVFRRLTSNMDNYPICSWVVAHAYAKAGKNFGVEPGAASPDDIWDFVTKRRDVYDQIRPLELLCEEELAPAVPHTEGYVCSV